MKVDSNKSLYVGTTYKVNNRGTNLKKTAKHKRKQLKTKHISGLEGRTGAGLTLEVASGWSGGLCRAPGPPQPFSLWVGCGGRGARARTALSCWGGRGRSRELSEGSDLSVGTAMVLQAFSFHEPSSPRKRDHEGRSPSPGDPA